jgi:XRE family transcriptional regulator of biofilm formation
MPPKRPGRTIRALRKARKTGLRELARSAQVPHGYLAELEAGTKTNPSLNVLQRLAKVLGVSVFKLLK